MLCGWAFWRAVFWKMPQGNDEKYTVVKSLTHILQKREMMVTPWLQPLLKPWPWGPWTLWKQGFKIFEGFSVETFFPPNCPSIVKQIQLTNVFFFKPCTAMRRQRLCCLQQSCWLRSTSSWEGTRRARVASSPVPGRTIWNHWSEWNPSCHP